VKTQGLPDTAGAEILIDRMKAKPARQRNGGYRACKNRMLACCINSTGVCRLPEVVSEKSNYVGKERAALDVWHKAEKRGAIGGQAAMDPIPQATIESSGRRIFCGQPIVLVGAFCQAPGEGPKKAPILHRIEAIDD
jgi:hypothetical protein